MFTGELVSCEAVNAVAFVPTGPPSSMDTFISVFMDIFTESHGFLKPLCLAICL